MERGREGKDIGGFEVLVGCQQVVASVFPVSTHALGLIGFSSGADAVARAAMGGEMVWTAGRWRMKRNTWSMSTCESLLESVDEVPGRCIEGGGGGGEGKLWQ